MAEVPRAVLIVGLPRSGSTILQYLMARDVQSVALGEIYGTIARLRDPNPLTESWNCSCGAERARCPFWSDLLDGLRSSTIQSGYEAVIRRFRKQFPGRVLIDSSKTLGSLEDYYEGSDVPVRVVVITRDFRGWVPSYSGYKMKRHGRVRMIRDSYPAEAYRWMRGNRRILEYMTRSELPWTQVSYENLVFDSGSEMERVRQFAGLSDHGEEGLVHELLGSPTIRFGQRDSRRLQYDHRWMSDLRSLLWGPFLWPVFRMNRRLHEDAEHGVLQS